MIKITYLDHSGFVVETEDRFLIFDYLRGDLLSHISKNKSIYVFVSHGHYDHYNHEIFYLLEEYLVFYILSEDVRETAEKHARSQKAFVLPEGKYKISDMEVRTLKSTDEGVAFCIVTNNRHIYYGGDLNWWKWRGESDAYNSAMERNYKKEISKIAQETFDFAFLPLDKRQGEDYYLGFDYFMKHTNTRYGIPMHMWGNYALAVELKERVESKEYRERIIVIERENQSFTLL